MYARIKELDEEVNKVKRKKLLTLSVLLLFVLSGFSVNMIEVSAAESPYIAVVPESTVNPTLTPGKNYTVSIYTDCINDDIFAYQFTLNYNPSVLEGIEVVNGDVIVGGSAEFLAPAFDNTVGELPLTVGFFFAKGEVTSGPGTLANVTFRVKDTGASTITIGPETKLKGWDDWDEISYNIIFAAEQPTHTQHGYFCNTEEPITHDIRVANVTPFPTLAIPGVHPSVDITVVVENEGNVNEAFNVTAYANNTAIETKDVINLGSGVNTSLTFAWDITGAELGNYTISATASTVPGETDTGDNTKFDGTVTVKLPTFDPVAIIIAEETVAYANETLIFEGGSSYDDDGGTIIAYDWDFGDETTGTGRGALHSYTTIGFYTVTLVVTDSQNQVSDPASLTIEIEAKPPEPPAYSAALVKWKAKAEARNWYNSTDLDGLLTLTALATNFGANDVNVTITFDIYVAHGGEWVYTDANDTKLEVSGGDVPVSVDIPPESCDFTGTKLVLDAFVTLEYYDADADVWTSASTKIIHFAIWP